MATTACIPGQRMQTGMYLLYSVRLSVSLWTPLRRRLQSTAIQLTRAAVLRQYSLSVALIQVPVLPPLNVRWMAAVIAPAPAGLILARSAMARTLSTFRLLITLATATLHQLPLPGQWTPPRQLLVPA